MRSYLWTWALVLAAACSAPTVKDEVAAPAGDSTSLLSEIGTRAAARDLQGLQALRDRARQDPKASAELARGIYWTGGVQAAKPDLVASCRDERLPAASDERQKACALLALAELAGDKPTNRVRAYGEGPFLDKQKLFIALVSVDGQPAEPFIVDTGAPTTVISQRYADRIQLPYRKDVAETSRDAAGNTVALHPTVLGLVKWGGIEVETVPAHVLALPENFKVGGILSPQDLLRGSAFEIDGPAQRLRVSPQQAEAAWAERLALPPIKAAIAWSGGNPLTEARVDDLPPLLFLLDSGAGANGVCDEALAKHGKATDVGRAAEGATAAGSARVRVGLEGRLAVASEVARPTPLFAKKCGDGSSTEPSKSGYIGAPWFWSHRTMFSSDRRALLFDQLPPAP